MTTTPDFSDIFFLLKQADLQITQLFEAQMSISLTRYELLMQLRKEDYLSQHMLQERLKIDQAAITRHLKILEGKNYIVRERNKANKREVIVHLSEKGKHILHTCDSLKDELVRILFSGYSHEQLTLILQFLNDFNQKTEIVSTTIKKRKQPTVFDMPKTIDRVSDSLDSFAF